MSSKTTIFSRPTTVILRILCGSSQESCMWAILPLGKRRKQKTTSSTPGWIDALPCHEHPVVRRGEGYQLVHPRRPHRRRLLDEYVLAGFERLLRELVVRRHRRRDHDGVELRIGEHLPVLGGGPGSRVARADLREPFDVDVAQPGQLRKFVEVAHEVRAPVIEADDADRRLAAHSFQTLPSTPWPLVAFRKSTITLPRRTMSA